MAKASVHIITTGGTIAATPSGMVTAADLLATIPDVATLADITVEPLFQIPSSLITPEDWLLLARQIDERWRQQPTLSGIVVTHGTDTIEESAFFCHLVRRDGRPVVFTGAMRAASALSADGPANLRAAIAVAADPGAIQRGVLLVLNDTIHAATTAVKAHTRQLEAFVSAGSGPLGTVYETAVRWYAPVIHTPAPFVLGPGVQLPQVEIIYSYAGADGTPIAAAIAAGAKGIVLAAFGSGRVTAGQIAAIQTALTAGIVVVMSSRIGQGAVETNYRDDLAPALGVDGVVLAGELNPQKARVLLQLALTQSNTVASIREWFATY